MQQIQVEIVLDGDIPVRIEIKMRSIDSTCLCALQQFWVNNRDMLYSRAIRASTIKVLYSIRQPHNFTQFIFLYISKGHMQMLQAGGF